MADEAVADVAALESPASGGAQQVESNLDDLDPAVLDELAGDGQGEDDDELDELELGFKKYQVPRSLKRSVEDWRKATTEKEQAVSARGKALDTRESEIEERSKAADEDLDNRAQLRRINSDLAEYQKLSASDWAAHRAQDPMKADDHWTNFQLLKDQKAELEGKIGEARTKRDEAQSADLTKRVNAVTEFGQKSIPGFNQKQIDTLIAFATEQGIDEATIKRNWSPTFYKLLHRAHLGEQVVKRAAAKKAEPKQEPTPLTPIRPNASPSRKPVAQMSMAEHAEQFRKEQEQKRA